MKDPFIAAEAGPGGLATPAAIPPLPAESPQAGVVEAGCFPPASSARRGYHGLVVAADLSIAANAGWPRVGQIG